MGFHCMHSYKYFATQVLVASLSDARARWGRRIVSTGTSIPMPPSKHSSKWARGKFSSKVPTRSTSPPGRIPMHFGDHRGFDVLNNPHQPATRPRIHAVGNEIGSHGGWIHNYFGEHVDTDPPKDMEKFLQLNKDALEQVAGKPVLEYSAPVGNQPQWVTRVARATPFCRLLLHWRHGMGPTQGYRKGRRAGRHDLGLPDPASGPGRFVRGDDNRGVFEGHGAKLARSRDRFHRRSQRQVRLIYFHPPGILRYEQVVREWLQKTRNSRLRGVFRWYTMSADGNFSEFAQARWNGS